MAPRSASAAITAAAGVLRESPMFALKADADDAHAGTGEARPEQLPGALIGEVDDVLGHPRVDVAGKLDERVAQSELARAPGEVVGVDRNAVPAHARSGPEGHEAERLGRRGIDHLPHVQAHSLAQQAS